MNKFNASGIIRLDSSHTLLLLSLPWRPLHGAHQITSWSSSPHRITIFPVAALSATQTIQTAPCHFLFLLWPTQRQAQKLISGPSLATKTQLLSFNRTQSRVDTGLLTRHNTLRRHLYVMVLSNNPTCRKRGNEEETSVHILCECEALASLRHAYLGSFFLDPEDIMKLSLGPIWNFGKETVLL